MSDQPVRFEEYLNARMPALYRYACTLTGNPHDAQDIVHDALIRVGRAWWRIRHKDSPERYVRTAILRQYLNQFRKHRDIPVATTPEHGADDPGLAEVDADLPAMLAGLPPRMRAVLVLRYVEQLTDSEAAEVLGCTTGTVRSQLSRARAKLRASHTEA
ncbi:MAG: SigE family RNA polymerase sigma factor [Mycobacteriales bacterium]